MNRVYTKSEYKIPNLSKTLLAFLSVVMIVIANRLNYIIQILDNVTVDG